MKSWKHYLEVLFEKKIALFTYQIMVSSAVKIETIGKIYKIKEIFFKISYIISNPNKKKISKEFFFSKKKAWNLLLTVVK